MSSFSKRCSSGISEIGQKIEENHMGERDEVPIIGMVGQRGVNTSRELERISSRGRAGWKEKSLGVSQYPQLSKASIDLLIDFK